MYTIPHVSMSQSGGAPAPTVASTASSGSVRDYYQTSVVAPVSVYDATHRYETYDYSMQHATLSSQAGRHTNTKKDATTSVPVGGDLGFIQPPTSSHSLPITLTELDPNNVFDKATANYNVTMYTADLLFKQEHAYKNGQDAYTMINNYQSGGFYTGNFDNDPLYFVRNPQKKTEAPPTENAYASVEIFSYFVPKVDGQYRLQFLATSDTKAAGLLWVGDTALVNYKVNNAVSNLRGGQSDVLTLRAGQPYPFRMQVGGKFSMAVMMHFADVYLNGQLLELIDTIHQVFAIHEVATKLPYEPIQLYYALTTSPSTPIGVYHCLVTPASPTNNYANNEALRQSRVGDGRYRIVSVPLTAVSPSAAPSGNLAFHFRNDGNLELVDLAAANQAITAAGTPGASVPTPPTLLALTHINNNVVCTAKGVGFDAVPDVQVNGISIASGLTSTSKTMTDPVSGVSYTQYAYGSYQAPGGAPATEAGTQYTLVYSLGGETRTLQSSFDSPNHVVVNNMDKAVQCHMTLTFGPDGNLSVNDTQKSLWSMFTDPQYSGMVAKIQSDASASVVNPAWYDTYYMSTTNTQGGPLHTLAAGQYMAPSLSQTQLISPNGKFRIVIEDNELVFQYCILADVSGSGTITDPVSTPNRYYLHAVETQDMRLGKTFVVDVSAHTMKWMPDPSALASSILLPGNSFTGVDDAYPPNVTGAETRYQHFRDMDASACQAQCLDSTSGCTHYYSYMDDTDVMHCTVGVGYAPVRQYPQNTVAAVKSSKLFMRNQTVSTQCTPDNRAPTVLHVDAVTSSATDPVAWSIDSTPYAPPPDREGPCGVDAIYKAYQQFSTAAPASNPVHESFVSRRGGWREAFTSAACTPVAGFNQAQCVIDLSNGFASLVSSPAAQTYYTHRFVDVSANYQDISGMINVLKNGMNTAAYDAIDNSGNLLVGDPSNRTNSTGAATLEQAMMHDTQKQLLAENQAYMIATVVAASLFIGILLL